MNHGQPCPQPWHWHSSQEPEAIKHTEVADASRSGRCRGAAPAVTENLRPLSLSFHPKCEKDNPESMAVQCLPYPAWGSQDSDASIERVALYHFILKSLEDFEVKSARGGGVRGSGKPMSFFEAWSR